MAEAVKVMVRVRPMNAKEKDRGTTVNNDRVYQRGGGGSQK